jgi:hypothetical protein
MYILASLYERGQRARLAEAVHQAPDEQAAVAGLLLITLGLILVAITVMLGG